MKKNLRFYLISLNLFVLLFIVLSVFALSSNAQVPTITSVSPLKGPVGTMVTLTGTNFNTTPENNIVFFGGVMATVDHVVSATEIVVKAPTGADGGFISITNLSTGLTVTSSKPFVLTYLNSGQISFNDLSDIHLLLGIRTVIAKDLNNDGKIDFITSGDSEAIQIFTNNSTPGSVSFSTSSPLNVLLNGDRLSDMQVADLNGDGVFDIVGTVVGKNKIIIAQGNLFNGTYSAQIGPALDVALLPKSIQIIDVDGDGKLDIVSLNGTNTGNQAIGTVSVIPNISNASTINFGTEVDFQLSPTPIYVHKLKSADLFGHDGKQDFVVSVTNSGTIGGFILKNVSTPGTPMFTITELPLPQKVYFELADVNEDGNLDLLYIAGFSDNGLSVCLNDGIGGFQIAVNYPLIPGTSGAGVTVGDVNGDGHIDILVGNYAGNFVNVFKNDPANIGSFISPVSFPVTNKSFNPLLEDVDGDGKQDIIAMPYNGNTFTLLLNNQTTPVELETLPGHNTTGTNVGLAGNAKANTDNFTISFEYGTDPNLAAYTSVDASTNQQVSLGDGIKTASYDLIGNFSTDLYYRVVAKDASNNVYRGEIVKIIPQTEVVGITTLSPNPNNGKTGSVIYKVEFSKIIDGVTAANFAITKTGGISSASVITNVIQNPIVKNIWQVTVGLGPVTADGTVQLSLANTDNFSAGVTNTLPLAGETYTIAPDISATTLPVTGLFSTGATLQGTIKSTVEDVTVGFDYGTSPFLLGAVHVNATVNGTVTAGSGAKTAEFQLSQVKPGEHFYRVTATGTTTPVINGEILSYYIPYSVKGIKTVSANPNDGKAGLLLYEVEFNGVVDNLTAPNFLLVTTGAVNATLSTIVKSGDPLKPNSWFVTVALGAGGDGTVNLQLKNINGLNITLSTPLPFIGETYIIDKAPATPTGLVAESGDGEVRVSWNANTETDLNAYYLYYGTTANPTTNEILIAGGAISRIINLLQNDQLYYFRLKAVDKFGNESDYSVDVTATPKAGNALKTSQTIGFGPLTERYYRDADFNLSATASSGLTDITFSSSDAAIATVTGNVVHILHAGTVTITAKQAGNSNYAAAQQATILTILPLAITVTADAKTKKVGEQDPEFTYAYTPKLIGNEMFTGSLTRQAGSGEGVYSILNNLLLSNDYSINYVGAELTITNKEIQTVTFEPLADRVYGGADFNLSATASSKLTAFTFSSSNTYVATVTGNVVHILHAGTTTITATEAGDANYATGQQDRTLTVLPLAITVTADAKTKKLGEQDPEFTFTYVPGLINNENFTGELSRLSGSNEGVYTITQNNLSLSNDYKITYIGANLTITNKKDQTISFGPLANKVYGDVDFDLGASSSFFGPVVTYTTSDDKVATIVNGKLHIVNAGQVVVYANHLGDEYVNAAAQVSQPLTIAKMDLIIQPDAKVKALGEQDPILTYHLVKGNLAGSDKFLGALERSAGEQLGIYPITIGSLVLNDNYTIQLMPANLVIELKSFDAFVKDATNVLTPNADGINDYLVFKDLAKYPPIAIVITDRLGRIIYKNEHYQNNWDGKYNGKPLTTDTYYYYLDFGKTYSKVKGYVTIVNGK